MKLFGGILTLVLALIISGVAAYFSVAGLAAIFSATFWSVVVMGSSLEAGKLVAAGWLHSNWHNPRVNKLHRGYMTAAVVILMMITALGIYGFLAKGHLEQQAAGAPVTLQIAQKEARMEQLKAEIARFEGRQTQMDTAINGVIAGDATKGLRARRGQNGERREIKSGIDAANAEMNKLTEELVPLKLQSSATEAKLGPIKYVAELFGWQDPEAAVRLVIVMIMFAFDPLAVVMMLSATITLGEVFQDRKRIKLVPTHHEVSVGDGLGEIIDDEPEAEPAAEPEPEAERIVLVEPAPAPSLHLDHLRTAADEASAGNFGEDVTDVSDVDFVLKLARPTAATPAPELVDETEHLMGSESNADRLREALDELEAAPLETEDGNVLQQLEQQVAYQKDDKEVLLEILERNPQLLQDVMDVVTEEVIPDVIDAVIESQKPPEEKVADPLGKKGWMDEKWSPPPAK